MTAHQATAAAAVTLRPDTRRLLNTPAQFHPVFGGFLSDHLPMTLVALDRLGAPPRALRNFHAQYSQQLEPVQPGSNYADLHASFMQTLQKDGRRHTLAATLPGLLSGCAADAYHPLIRLAYGVHTHNNTEIAAGLAYLQLCGPHPAIDAAANNATNATDARPQRGVTRGHATLVNLLQDLPTRPRPQGRSFAARASAVANDPAFAPAAAACVDWLHRCNDPTRAISEFALQVFAGTHNFFALHLVTASHAYRVLRPFAGPHADCVFALAVVQGYLTTGAAPVPDLPAFGRQTPLDYLSVRQPLRQLLRSPANAHELPDEHAIKIGYSACAQACFFADSRYLSVTAKYLQAQLSATGAR